MAKSILEQANEVVERALIFIEAATEPKRNLNTKSTCSCPACQADRRLSHESMQESAPDADSEMETALRFLGRAL